jgi:hypothetical protein
MSIRAIGDAPLNKFHRRLTWACARGPFLDCYLLSIIGVSLVGMSNELHLTTGDESLIGAAALVGTPPAFGQRRAVWPPRSAASGPPSARSCYRCPSVTSASG